ncbi:hypothetical protein ccbrp13_55710 [Ktedonobacteria bacterium brp13]|nr:hypothetical protein ccbrp13_55710 [Ktedonobacteria bacterium brp13]
MSNDKDTAGVAIVKLIILAGGAIAGALLTNWFEKALSERAHQQSEYDRSRYAQGLTPLSPQGSSTDRKASEQPRIIKVEEYPSEEHSIHDDAF